MSESSTPCWSDHFKQGFLVESSQNETTDTPTVTFRISLPVNTGLDHNDPHCKVHQDGEAHHDKAQEQRSLFSYAGNRNLGFGLLTITTTTTTTTTASSQMRLRHSGGVQKDLSARIQIILTSGLGPRCGLLGE